MPDITPSTPADPPAFARVGGEPWSELPEDLYIPPEALEVFLETFEGPLDLLLWLIKRQNLDILDIPIARITEQYMEYVAVMKELRLELAAEYLVMAATLAEIKSRMLLPRQKLDEEEEGDPRAELIRRLQEYERYKQAAEAIDELPRMERELFPVQVQRPDNATCSPPPEVDLKELLVALNGVIKRADMFSHHQIEREALSVRERMGRVLEQLSMHQFTPFTELFTATEGRLGVVVTFIAILELIKAALIEIVQAEVLGVIHVKATTD